MSETNDRDPMPVFTLKAQDVFTPVVVMRYHELCVDAGLYKHGIEVSRAYDEIMAWRERNPDKVKVPYHKHVPVDMGQPSTEEKAP
ncbi:MAG TPA: hypothetical protein VFC00_15610 [Micromonosporaceae bacterium]|nr:hypothetical protein [Micromonosporaceae bacterium]